MTHIDRARIAAKQGRSSKDDLIRNPELNPFEPVHSAARFTFREREAEVKAARLLALAMVAGLVLVASLGAGTASASTALCKTQESPYCKTENRYPGGTEFRATSNFVEISSSDFLSAIYCYGSELKSKLASNNPAALAPFEKWSLSRCEAGTGAPCTVTERNTAQATGGLHWTAADDGILIVGTAWDTGWDIDCGANYECTLVVGEPRFEISGGKPAWISTESEGLLMGSSPCALGSKWSGAFFTMGYSLKSPNPAYVAKAEDPPPPPSGVVLCDSSEEGATDCAAENIYPKGTSLAAEASNIKIQTPISTITCNKGSLKAELTATSGVPPELLPLQMTGFSLQECNFPGFGNCTATTNSLGTGGINWIESPSNGGWRGGVTWTFQCGTFSCALSIGDSKAGDSMVLTGGNPATLVMTGYELFRGSGCFEENLMSASYTLTSPKPVYVKLNG